MAEFLPTSPSQQKGTNAVVGKLNYFPEDMLGFIFQYFSWYDLLHIEIVSSRWRELCRQFDHELYYPLVERAWANNVNRPSNLLLFPRIQYLPLTTLKKALRGLDLTRCIEKHDFQCILQAKLLFQNVMEIQLKSEDIRFKGKYLSMYYPDWTLTISPTKASLLYAQLDMNRQQIYSGELCSIKWIFRFKEHAALDMQNAPFWISKFDLDGSMYSELNEQEYQWRFVTNQNGVNQVQVDNYPALTSSRTLGGYWRLENPYVFFTQSEVLDGDSIPLFESH